MRPRIVGVLLIVATGLVACAPAPPPVTVQGVADCADAQRERAFITSVAPGGRYFLDQHGAPILVRGDSPWSGLSDWSEDQAATYFGNRDAHGYNASIISLVGSTGNGGPSNSGATFDGITPFRANDPTDWNELYWARMDTYLELSCEHGNTLFLYPMDSWNEVAPTFADASLEQLREYGHMVAERFRNYPNIVWMAGGDYEPDRENPAGSPSDHRFGAVLEGIRSAGNRRPFSIQINPASYSAMSPYWATRVDWNFVYTYDPTYAQVLAAYRLAGHHLPALFSEGNYEGENNTGGPDTTTETLRREVLWAVTSGSPGEFAGTQDWLFDADWEERLDSAATGQIQALRDVIAEIAWWTLSPDDEDPLVIGDRGTRVGPDARLDVLDSDYVTAASNQAGSLAMIYVPTPREITLDLARLQATTTALWIDPADATGRRRPAHIDTSGHVATPGENSDGDGDWLLLITSGGAVTMPLKPPAAATP